MKTKVFIANTFADENVVSWTTLYSCSPLNEPTLALLKSRGIEVSMSMIANVAAIKPTDPELCTHLLIHAGVSIIPFVFDGLPEVKSRFYVDENTVSSLEESGLKVITSGTPFWSYVDATDPERCAEILEECGVFIKAKQSVTPPWVYEMVEEHREKERSVARILTIRSKQLYRDVLGVIAKHLWSLRFSDCPTQ